MDVSFPTPAVPHFGSNPAGIKPKPFFEPDKKLPGRFGSPASELYKGNSSGAKLSCIQEAIGAGEEIPVDDATVFEFTSKASGMTSLPKPSSAVASATTQLLASSRAPAAFARNASCRGDLQQTACVHLLDKATSEVPQAYHNSSLNIEGDDVWDEVLAFLGLKPLEGMEEEKLDVITALKRLDEKNQRETGGKSSLDLSTIQNEDPLLVATNLLIQRIDEALARGNEEGAVKAKSILKKINPSAAYAVSCVLSPVARGGLNEDLDPSGRPRGSFFGPLSGVDYGKRDEMKTHGVSVPLLAVIVSGSLTLAALITSWVHHSNDADAKKAEVDRNHKNYEIKEYLGCSGALCDKLYPEGSKAVKEAKDRASAEAPKNIGTSGPERPVEEGPADMFAPSVPGKPRPGSGGSGGEMVPGVIETHPSRFEEASHKAHDFNKHVDPEASVSFCLKAVRDYKALAAKKTGGPSRLGVRILRKEVSIPIPAGAFGIASFEDWTPSYWAEQKKNKVFDPRIRQNKITVILWMRLKDYERRTEEIELH